MDAGCLWVHHGVMTALVIVTLLLILAIAGPLFGADSRSSGAWTPSEHDQPLWTDGTLRHVH